MSFKHLNLIFLAIFIVVKDPPIRQREIVMTFYINLFLILSNEIEQLIKLVKKIVGNKAGKNK